MTDWYQCTSEEQALIEGCGPEEFVVCLGGVMTRAPKQHIAEMYTAAYVRALEAALTQLGIEAQITGTTADFGDAVPPEDMQFEPDMLSGCVTVRVVMPDGRRAESSASLVRPRPH